MTSKYSFFGALVLLVLFGFGCSQAEPNTTATPDEVTSETPTAPETTPIDAPNNTSEISAIFNKVEAPFTFEYPSNWKDNSYEAAEQGQIWHFTDDTSIPVMGVVIPPKKIGNLYDPGQFDTCDSFPSKKDLDIIFNPTEKNPDKQIIGQACRRCDVSDPECKTPLGDVPDLAYIRWWGGSDHKTMNLILFNSQIPNLIELIKKIGPTIESKK